MEMDDEIRDRAACTMQGTNDWFKARLGRITSSKVRNVMLGPSQDYKDRIKSLEADAKNRASEESMVNGKANRVLKAELEAKYLDLVDRSYLTPAEYFSDTAKSYLYEVASERNLRKNVIDDDTLFDEYLMRVELSTKAIRYGQETEDIARKVYEISTKNEVVEAGFIMHKDITHYGDSPDGIIVDKDGRPIGALEIKCPKPETFIRYKATIHNADELKEEKPEYYWQCQSHCECNGLPWCDFVFFDKMQQNGFVCIRIDRNDEDIALMKERIVIANQFIDEILK